MNYSELTSLSLNLLGENPSSLIRWTDDEVEFAVNNSLKKVSSYMGPWYRETVINATDATDTYSLSNDTTNVVKLEISGTLLQRTEYGNLPTDGKTGSPYVFALMQSGPTVTQNKAIVLYPAPDGDYDYIATEQYQAKADTTDVLDIPVSLDIEDALVYYTCYFLSMKSSVSSSSEEAGKYLKLAKDALLEASEMTVNYESHWGRGYFSGGSY